jgi:predicted RNA binding protein YcfA (HicA-like mRNA interferase family)
MPKLPRIGGRECIAALRRLGFTEVRQRGSHVVLRRGAEGCVVPLHRELKVGTLAGILRQAGVEAEQFLEALHRK